jgi:flagellar hook-associated protein 3 FlgL
MSLTSLGDMSQMFFLRRNNVETRTQINTLSAELTTGLKADVPKAVGHDFSLLSGLERGISMSQTYVRATNEARVVTETMQNSLGLAQDSVEGLASSLLSVSNSGLPTNVTTAVQDGRNALDAIVGAMNTSVAGRFLFSGQATDTRPVMDADQILNAVRPLAQAATTPQDMIAAVDAWFADGADFTTTAYNGTAAPSAGFLVGERDTLSLEITADRREVRDALAAAVKVALLEDLSLPNGHADVAIIMKNAAEELFEGAAQLTLLRGELGQTQEAIEVAESRANTQLSALQINRSDLLSADPFETATALEDASMRLESLYTLTARLSRLSLTDFLR